MIETHGFIYLVLISLILGFLYACKVWWFSWVGYFLGMAEYIVIKCKVAYDKMESGMLEGCCIYGSLGFSFKTFWY